MRSFGVALRVWRKSQGWTQAHLAESVRVNVHMVSRWESGKSFPRKDNARKLECLGFEVQAKSTDSTEALELTKVKSEIFLTSKLIMAILRLQSGMQDKKTTQSQIIQNLGEWPQPGPTKTESCTR